MVREKMRCGPSLSRRVSSLRPGSTSSQIRGLLFTATDCSDLKRPELILFSCDFIEAAENLDTYERIATKLDVREFDSREVSTEIRRRVLEAARLTASGNNLQHWRFILTQDKDNLKRLAEDSTSGRWVAGANFAVVVLTNPKYGFHLVDAGRVIQDMQLAAWNDGVASGIYTGFNKEAMVRDFGIPAELVPSAAVGFGYPRKKIIGKKNRKPLLELAFLEKYGKRLGI